ncbi:MAG TPA: preprotein translocase subunit SecE [Gaiellaceae bacterium]|nr:preprotein translocase subunit SecE [Gaiellaceae bacterium]
MSDARSERHPAVGRPGGSGGGTPHAEEQRRKGHFVQESWAELKKVEWPGQNQVIQGTVVVLIACLVVGSYLYLNDIVWKHVVSKVFLGQ